MAKSKANAESAEPAIEVQTETEQAVKKPLIPKDIDQSTTVMVRNGFQGRLVYKSPRTGEKFTWDAFGSEQELELRELRAAKNSAKRFFAENWFMFDREYAWVIEYLGLKQYYKNAVSLDQFDEIFTKTPAEIVKVVSAMSAGQKKSLTYRAREAIVSGEIDSNKAIAALEKALGVELIER